MLAERGPSEALPAWLEEFAEFLLAKDGMSEIFRTIMADGENPFLDLRVVTRDAVQRLIRAAAGVGVRQDLDPMDILTAMHGMTLVTKEPAQLARLVRLLLDGLRVG